MHRDGREDVVAHDTLPDKPEGMADRRPIFNCPGLHDIKTVNVQVCDQMSAQRGMDREVFNSAVAVPLAARLPKGTVSTQKTHRNGPKSAENTSH